MPAKMLLLAIGLVLAVPQEVVGPVKGLEPSSQLQLLPYKTVGRYAQRNDGGVVRQWPGTYFEANFLGSEVYFRIGAGDMDLRLSLDRAVPQALERASPGLYRIAGLVRSRHHIRIDIASETKAAPTVFGGFFAAPETRALPTVRRARAIEFIGDTHTVGYANLSNAKQCSDETVRRTTDTSQGIAALTAARFDADYQVNAISGRGVVRNYNGAAADTVPTLYPFSLFDKSARTADPSWHPQVLAISLGTNDFSTPLHAGEEWTSRVELRGAFQMRYVGFVRDLRLLYPKAYIVLWATDIGDGETSREVANVAQLVNAGGVHQVGLVIVSGLRFSACNSHPGLEDDRKIADALAEHLIRNVRGWQRPG
ncbi:MAG: GDSL family lipase [Alphaproteobacteria bacterium]|nr:MAG: GDSL family lipase [Alphaproteobacteria bacterium]